MSLELSQLERVRELAGGIVQARCPACAEGGRDRKGEHLRIYPDGRFGCCVCPKDHQHRQRIFALAGVKEPGTFTVRLKTSVPTSRTKSIKLALGDAEHGAPGTGHNDLRLDGNGRSPDGRGCESERTDRDGFGTFGTDES